jgi:hypothetical protein
MLTQALLGFLPAAPHNKLYVDPYLPAWLPDLTVHDLRIGKHMLDIHFWREGEQTSFEVIKGDPTLVERRDIATEGLGLKTTSELIQTARVSAERSNKSGNKRRATRRASTQSG